MQTEFTEMDKISQSNVHVSVLKFDHKIFLSVSVSVILLKNKY